MGFVGTLRPWHGVEGLIEAFAVLHGLDPDVRLLIVGDGPLRNTLESMAADRGVSHAVDFRGAVEPSEVPRMLASMDVAVAPYPPLDDFYFSPLKLFEYMAAGCAIVAAAIGQINQTVGDFQGNLARIRAARADRAVGWPPAVRRHGHR